MGARPFLYWRQGSKLVFASDSRIILNVPGVPRRLNAAALHSLASSMISPANPHETLHEGIESLTPGTSLIASEAGVKQRTWWRLEIRSGLVPRKPEQVFEALREIVTNAVECRIDRRASVAALLSGGLDSSSVVAIAARCLERKNRGLQAFSAAVPDERLAAYADEREYVEEFRSWPNVRIEYVTSHSGGPFDHIDNPPWFEASPIRMSRLYLYEALHSAALSRNADILLEGDSGEFGPSNFGNRYFAELAIKLRLPTLFRELKMRRGTSPPWRVLASQFRDIAWPHRRAALRFFIAPDFERRHGPRTYFKSRWPDQRRFQAAGIRSWLSQRAHPIGKTFSGHLATADPFEDKRILEFCVAVHPDLKTHYGCTRYLIRRAMEGILPPKIQWRANKMQFSPDYYLRYNLQLEKARDFVRAIGEKDPVRSVVDVDQLRRNLIPVDPARINVNAILNVPLTIYLICFLRQFPEFRP